MSTSEKELEPRQFAVSSTSEQNNGYIIPESPLDPRFALSLRGAFLTDHQRNETSNVLYVHIQQLFVNGTINRINIEDNDIAFIANVTDEPWEIPVVDVDVIDSVTESTRRNVFTFSKAIHEKLQDDSSFLRVKFVKTFDRSLPLQLTYDPSPIDTQLGVILASVVLLGLYIMIIWEVVHRTFAAMIASTMAIAILAALNERPTMPEIISWIDVETLLLLFGMMILVAILSETGIFDYLAVYAYKVWFFFDGIFDISLDFSLFTVFFFTAF